MIVDGAVAAQIMVLEGLHPFYDERVRDLYDFKIYLDISDEVKFAWKIQRDMKERGHSLESIKASIEARRPDFEAYIDPQKKHADVIIQVSAQGPQLQLPSRFAPCSDYAMQCNHVERPCADACLMCCVAFKLVVSGRSADQLCIRQHVMGTVDERKYNAAIKAVVA